MDSINDPIISETIYLIPTNMHYPQVLSYDWQDSHGIPFEGLSREVTAQSHISWSDSSDDRSLSCDIHIIYVNFENI